MVARTCAVLLEINVNNFCLAIVFFKIYVMIYRVLKIKTSIMKQISILQDVSILKNNLDLESDLDFEKRISILKGKSRFCKLGSRF